jgi:heme-degrading monooxygenase HmoA
MLVERSEILIKEGMEDEFTTLMADKAVPLLKGLPGVNAVSYGRGVENPDKFILMVEWAAMSDHIAFTKAPVFPEFRALLMPFSKGGAMEHFEMG